MIGFKSSTAIKRILGFAVIWPRMLWTKHDTMIKTNSSGFIWKLLRVIFLKISFLMGNMVEVKTNQRKRFRDKMSIFFKDVRLDISYFRYNSLYL